jgi:adenylate cyclase
MWRVATVQVEECTYECQLRPRSWEKLLNEGHKPLPLLHVLFRYLLGPPRCKGCHNPFGGIGGKLVGLLGFTLPQKTLVFADLMRTPGSERGRT